MISIKLPNQSSVITVMTKAVIKASKGLLRDFSELENLQVSYKGNKEFVTSADLKSDEILKEELMHARPRFSYLSEETEEVVGIDPTFRWIVDPLDGTTNYMHGFPHWAISVALEKDSEIIAAVTYNPIANEMFWSEKGCGAYVNDKKIRVSKKRSLSDLLIAFANFDENINRSLASTQYSVRRTGSTTLNMAYFAAGRIDLVLSAPNPKIWDIAAGLLLAKEAGGMVVDKNCKPINSYNDFAILSHIDLLPLVSKMVI